MATENRGPELLAVNIAFVAVAVLACALRCFVRIKMVKAFGGDDWLMLSALALFIAYITSSIVGVTYGTGQHHADLDPQNVLLAKRCWYLCYLFYSLAMICAKLSIGFLLLRISNSRLHTWILYLAMFVSVVAGMTFFFVCMFQCSPIPYMWDRINIQGTCINNVVIEILGYVYSTFSIMSDFTFAIIPAFLVWNLQLKRKAKIALIPLITMGCIASAAVIARLPFVKYFNSPDFLWSTTDIAIWSTVEQGLAITAGSLATLRPLFFSALRKLGLTTQGRSSARRPSAYKLSAPTPGQETGASRSEKFDTELYKLSGAGHTTRGSQEDSLPIVGDPSLPGWSLNKKRIPESDDDNSEKNLTQRSARPSQDNEAMHIMVHKSFFVTDEERASLRNMEGAVLR